jgi:hypothetical protein
MNVPNPNQPAATADEEIFIRKALKSVEKAEKFQRIKQIVVTCLAFLAAFWLASKGPSPELNIECTVIICLGLIAAVCTAKILALINKNTKAVLLAIADLHRK